MNSPEVMARNAVNGIGRSILEMLRKKPKATGADIDGRVAKRVLNLAEGLHAQLSKAPAAERRLRGVELAELEAKKELAAVRSDRDLWKGRYEGAVETAKILAPKTPAPTPAPLTEDPAEDGFDKPPITTSRLYSLLALVISDIEEAFEAGALEDLTVRERDLLQSWAALTHLAASDNDDVEVPERPSDILEKLGLDETDHRKAKARRERHAATLEQVRELDRVQLIDLLNSISVQCYDEESDAELREAVAVNVADGTLSAGAVLTAGERAESIRKTVAERSRPV